MEKADGQVYQFNLDKTINRLVIVVSIGVIAHLVFLLLTNDRNVFQYLAEIELYFVLLILIFLSFNWIGHACRIMIWTNYLKQPFKFKTGLKIAIYTELGAAITPTLIGGGPIKMGMLIKHGLSTGKAGFMTLLNGCEDFIMYTSVFLIACFHARASVVKILESIWGFINTHWTNILLLIILIFLFSLIKKRTPWLNRLRIIPSKYDGQWTKLKIELAKGWTEMINSFKRVIRDGLGHFALSFTIMLLQWISRFSVLVVLLYALGVDFKPFNIYIQQWIVYLTMIFIPTPGATGGAEATFFLLFDGDIPKDLLPLIVSTWRFFIYYLMLFASVIIIQYFRWETTRTDDDDDSQVPND